MLVCLLLEKKILYILPSGWKKAGERGENEVLNRKRIQIPEHTGVGDVSGNPPKTMGTPSRPYFSFSFLYSIM